MKRQKTANQFHVNVIDVVDYDPLDDESYLAAFRIAVEMEDKSLQWEAVDNLRRHSAAWGRAKRKIFGDDPARPAGVIGRPRMFADGTMKTGSVRLSAADWELLRRIGDGNASEGVRRLCAQESARLDVTHYYGTCDDFGQHGK